jgi:hypothetical protein
MDGDGGAAAAAAADDVRQPRPSLSIAPRQTISSRAAHAGSRQKLMDALSLRNQRSACTPLQ